MPDLARRWLLRRWFTTEHSPLEQVALLDLGLAKCKCEKRKNGFLSPISLYGKYCTGTLLVSPGNEGTPAALEVFWGGGLIWRVQRDEIC